MKSRNSAFTLIELLVVIAIIGILAGVVLASLNSARNKGRIASIKSNLRNAVSQSNIYFNENGTYTGFCSDPTIVSIISALGGAGNAACYVNPNTIQDVDWGVAATFDGQHFIADPKGVIQLDSANSGGNQSWDTAMTTCASLGKRLASASGFRALYDINPGVQPTSVTVGTYWTHTERPANLSEAYYLYMQTGSGTTSYFVKTNERLVRCGS